MEALSRDCRTGCPWKIIYKDDLVIMSNNLEDLKSSLETCSLRINVGKTKILGSLGGDQMPTANAEWPCGVCWKGDGVNSILYQSNKVPEYILKKTRSKLFKLFQYLSDVIGESSSCVDAINAHFTAA